MAAKAAPDIRVRYREDVGFELRCEGCAPGRRECWWPLTLEFWYPARGLRRCRACLMRAHALSARAAYSRDPEKHRQRQRAMNRERCRRYRARRRASVA